MDNLTELRIEYKYYDKVRATPIFIANDELLSFTFNEFYGLMLKEVSYLQNITSNKYFLSDVFFWNESNIYSRCCIRVANRCGK